MAKIIPPIIAIVIIAVVIMAVFLPKYQDKYSYSKERKDLIEYFGITTQKGVPVMLGDSIIKEQALFVNGKCYFDLNTVAEYFTDRFYVTSDADKPSLIYSYPEYLMEIPLDTEYYLEIRDIFSDEGERRQEDYVIAVTEKDKIYICIDFLKRFKNFSYEFLLPNHLQLDFMRNDREAATVLENNAVRERGGIKSPILEDVYKDDTVYVLEKMETWCKVKTKNSVIGYIENKFLSDSEKITFEPLEEAAPVIYPAISRGEKINLVWHQVFKANAETKAIANTKNLNVVSPTWFSIINEAGEMTSLANSAYVQELHNKNIEVWGLVDNFDKEVDFLALFSKRENRRALIGRLSDYVAQYDLDGINIDFEEISEEQGPHFVQFLREMSIESHRLGYVLSVDNYVPRESTAHYNRKEQGLVVDYVIIMGYDEHWGGGGVAGSVASIDFVDDGIAQTVALVDPKKVINALPFYTRVWTTASDGKVTSDAVGMAEAEKFIKDNELEETMIWDEVTCQNYAQMTTEAGLRQVWLENEESIRTKLNVMEKYGIAGVAAWKLGLEKPEIWDVIAEYLGK